MARFVNFIALSLTLSTFGFAQTSASHVKDQSAITLATRSILTLTSGVTTTDVTLTGNATWIAGSETKSGSITLMAKGNSESRVEISLSDQMRTEVRTMSQGFPAGEWSDGTDLHSISQHNCWSNAAWFFPALSSLNQVKNAGFGFIYVGQEQHNSLTAQHLKVIQYLPQDSAALNLSRLGTTDFYIDPVSSLVMAIAYNVHPDADMKRDIPMEIRFADYRLVNGIEVPHHIQQLLNGNLIMDVIVSSAIVNSGLSDTQFVLSK